MGFSVNKMLKIDESVVKNYNKQLINNLNERGWAIYKAPNLNITSLDELEEMISEGSEKERLTNDTPYQILPFIEDDSNYEEVRKAMLNCIVTHRYPFFVNLLLDDVVVENPLDYQLTTRSQGLRQEEDGVGKLKTEGVYLIDSILFNSILNIFELIPDYMLMDQLNIYTENKGNIVLTVYEIDKILKQMTLQYRKEH